MTFAKRPVNLVLFLLLVGAAMQTANSQVLRLPRPSQKASVTQTLGATDISITYSRPGVKGRTIFADAPASMEDRAKGEATLDNQNERKPGEPMVPYNHVWRAGANEATLFQVTDDVLINGQKLAAGLYSLHMIPNRDDWTIIFNREAGQWGSFNYDMSKDALRIKVKPQWVSDNQEWLTYDFRAITDNSTQVTLGWEKARVAFLVQAAVHGPASRSTLMQTIGVSDLLINYSTRPGGLVDETRFSISDDVLISGQKLASGNYNLRIVPGDDQWILVFNDADMKRSSLQLRLKPTTANEKKERPQFLSPSLTPNSAVIVLRDNSAAVSFAVEIPDVSALVRANIDAITAANPTNESIRLSASSYYAGLGNWAEALKWVEESIRVKATFRNLSTKAIYLHSAGRTNEALSVAVTAITQGKADRVDTSSFEKKVAQMRSEPRSSIATVAAPTPTPEVRPPSSIQSQEGRNSATSTANVTVPAPSPEVRPPARMLTREESTSPSVVPTSGHYYALVIGNDRYMFVPGLKLAEADARAVASVLQTRFGFSTQLLLDAKRQEIFAAINSYRRNLEPGDNLLVYYAGHGYFDREIDLAYWLPVDATKDDNANWISADDITRNIRGVPAQHILIVSDSCYSGAISRELTLGAPEATVRSKFLQKMITGKSRNLMSSGSNEPVSDSGGSGHSVFARAFLVGLEQFDKDVFTAAELFRDFIQERVAGGAMQTPEYSPLRNSGHESGDFVFVRKQ